MTTATTLTLEALQGLSNALRRIATGPFGWVNRQNRVNGARGEDIVRQTCTIFQPDHAKTPYLDHTDPVHGEISEMRVTYRISTQIHQTKRQAALSSLYLPVHLLHRGDLGLSLDGGSGLDPSSGPNESSILDGNLDAKMQIFPLIKPAIRKQRRGFTLIEMILCVVIVGIIAAISLPKFTSLHVKANDSSIRTFAAALRINSFNNAVLYRSKIAGGFPVTETNVCSLASISRFVESLPPNLSIRAGSPAVNASCDPAVKPAGSVATCLMYLLNPDGSSTSITPQISCAS